MSATHRFLKFWPQDWRGDPALRLCSLEARGLWIEMMCLAHDAEPYGHVVVNGRAATIEQIGVNASCNPRRIPKLLAELEANGVFSRTEEGVIFSRRMVKDSETSQQGRNYVARRWRNGGRPEAGAVSESPPNSPPNTQESESESESESDISTPSRAVSAKGRRGSNRGTRLPDNWQPSPADVAYAQGLGLTVSRTAEDFRGYWLAKAGKDAVKMDWSLTWQGWCRREAERRGTKPKDGGGNPPPPPRFL